MTEGVYELYWQERTASLAPMAALEEIGVPYIPHELKRGADNGHHVPQSYCDDIHPMGLIPALRLPEGHLMWEAAGIMICLADRHPDSGLAPEAGTLAHAHYCQWISWGASMLSPEYKRYYYAFRYALREEDQDANKTRALEILDLHWRVVEDAVKGQTWIAGDVFSGADYFIAMYAAWYPDEERFMQLYPEVTRICAAANQRPAMAKARELHGH